MIIEFKKTQGNIIDMIERGEINATAHGCNCFHTMGSGIAKTFNEYTNGELLKADKETSYGDINKLGKHSSINYNGVDFYNIYSQFVHAGYLTNEERNITYVNWSAVAEALLNIMQELPEDSNTVLALPYIGCGLAGGAEDDLTALLYNMTNAGPMLQNGNLTILLVEFKA